MELGGLRTDRDRVFLLSTTHRPETASLAAFRGRPSCLLFVTRDNDHVPSHAFRTLFLQELLSNGVLGQSFVTSAAHAEADVKETREALDAALTIYRRAIDRGSVEGLLRGRPVVPATAPRRLA